MNDNFNYAALGYWWVVFNKMGIGEMMIDRCQRCGETERLITDTTMNKNTCDAVSFEASHYGEWEHAVYLRCLNCHPYEPVLYTPIDNRFDHSVDLL